MQQVTICAPGKLTRFSNTNGLAHSYGALMTNSFTKTNFGDIEEMYAQYGMEETGTARYVRADAGAETIGVSLYELKPGKRTGFAHRHKAVEEIYIVLAGSGRMKIDDDIVTLGERDIVRVAPTAIREFEAGADGLELLATGGHVEGDGETVEDWWK